jgi:c(7)-type cytochrome triheme protein
MTRIGIALVAVLLTTGLISVAGAVPPGFTLEFDGKGEGKVLFSGTVHTRGGRNCADCHMDVFYVSRNSQITRADHKRKQACFVCHDGVQAFAARMNCERCHQEPEAEPAAEAAAESQAGPPTE